MKSTPHLPMVSSGAKENRSPLRVAFVIQRYGLEVNGGAELLCRWIAEHLAKYYKVEVLTTQALDYITWKNHYPRGRALVNQIPVRRFPVRKERDPNKFGQIQEHVFNHPHLEKDELRWLKQEGPYSPTLIREVKRKREEFDYFIFFSYRYYHSYYGINTVPEKSILVPTAEHDQAIYLSIFRSSFTLPLAIVYSSVEEKGLINQNFYNEDVPSDIVGTGVELPPETSATSFRQKFNMPGRFIVYIGRIDENKGCPQLFRYFLRFLDDTKEKELQLLLIGSSVIEVPQHPQIRHLGYLSDQDKFDALASAELLVMPSLYESLSIVLLEAWAMSKPALVNANCEVLRGQCLRSNAGLFYTSYEEFQMALELLLKNPTLSQALGSNGRRFYQQNYSWDIIEKKYINLINQLEIRRRAGAPKPRA